MHGLVRNHKKEEWFGTPHNHMPVAEASLPTAQRSGFQETRWICSFSYSRTRIMFQYVGYCWGWSMTKPRVRVPNSRLKKRASAHGGLAAAFMSSAHPIALKQAQLRIKFLTPQQYEREFASPDTERRWV